MDTFSERRLVENEMMFRAANRKVQEFVKHDRKLPFKKDGDHLHFYCECSNLECRDRIMATIHEYEDAAPGRKEFIILPGHENRDIEKVVRRNKRYVVVEKFMDPAKVAQANA